MLKLILLSQDGVNSFEDNAQILYTDSLKKSPIATQNPLCQLLLFTVHYSLFIANLIHVPPPISSILPPDDQILVQSVAIYPVDVFDQRMALESLAFLWGQFGDPEDGVDLFHVQCATGMCEQRIDIFIVPGDVFGVNNFCALLFVSYICVTD